MFNHIFKMLSIIFFKLCDFFHYINYSNDLTCVYNIYINYYVMN